MANDTQKYCKLQGSNRIYVIEKIIDKKVTLRYENSLVTTDIQNIEYVDNSKVNKKASTYKITLETVDVPNEIMLRHKLKETAISELDKYLDQALLAKLGRVKIIHGKHGGVLRNAVHEYLAMHPYVKEFHIADYPEGGLGVTIAILGRK